MSEDVQFEAAARDVLQRTRSAFAALVDATGADSTGPSSLAAYLHVHKKIAWQVWNLLHASDPLQIVRYLPTRRSARTFLDAAARCNANAELVAGVAERLDEYEEFARRHGAGREEMEMLLASLGSKTGEHVDLQWYKAAFLGNSYILGAQARTAFRSLLLRPSASSGFLDCIAIRGLVDLRRTRPDVQWLIGRTRALDDQGAELAVRFVPLEHLDAAQPSPPGAPLWSAFCSHPVPAGFRAPSPDGFVEDWLKTAPVGKTGEQTCIMAECGRVQLSQVRTSEEDVHSITSAVDAPCEWFVLDQFFHRSLWPGVRPEGVVFSDIAGGRNLPPRMRPLHQRLPIGATVEHLGRGPAAGFCAHIPRYVEMTTAALQRLGWEPDEFEVFRIVLQYPPIPATVVMYHELPPA